MSKSWRIRLISTLVGMVTSFIVLSVIEKLFYHNENWLLISAPMSITYGVGYFVAKIIADKIQNKWHRLAFDVVVSIIAFILLAFALGVIGDMPDWVYYTTSLSMFLNISLVINNIIT